MIAHRRRIDDACEGELGKSLYPGCSHAYTEVMVAARRFRQQLPHSIAAFFIQAVACESCVKKSWLWKKPQRGFNMAPMAARRCTRWTATAYGTFLDAFNLTAAQVPLLVLNRSNWERPFAPFKPTD